jgi:outer membrane protein TolC
MKKILSFIITLALLVSTGTMAFAAVPQDVEGTSYEKAIITLVEKEIITGDSSGLFHPESTLTRAQACIMVVKAGSGELVDEPSGFTDMTGYGWAEPYIRYAVEYGITTGYPDGTFKPGRYVTTNELVTFTLRAAGYGDERLGGNWPTNYLNQAATLDVLKSLPEELPVYATKEMAAQIIYSGLSLIQKAELEKVLDLDEATTDSAIQFPEVIVPDMEFVGPGRELTLVQTLDIAMTQGLAIQKAENTLLANRGKTKAYYENGSNLNKLQDSIDQARASMSGADTTTAAILSDYLWSVSEPSNTQKKMIDEASAYAKTQTTKNYDAEVNLIERGVIQDYYQLIQAREGALISGNNKEVQKTLYDVTKRKYQLGVASKMDLLKAELGYREAVTAYEESTNSYKLAQMNFNVNYGFELMEKVELADALTPVSMSKVPMDEAIKLALVHRNEIAFAQFNNTYQSLSLIEAGYNVGKTSSTYLAAQYAALEAEYNAKLMPQQIEMDVRNKYMDMVQKSSALDSARLNRDNSKETYRLAKLQYDAGLITITEVQQAQILSYTGELSYIAAVLAYNLAVLDYQQAMTVGTFSAPL